ncbi:DE-cadherin-like isoform X2 [Penaeus vannamei]|uniref:DE-cadherin-like isoform X2 n=1 Tax=Penaeus vannamei TaxID=6689 RepID=UPI00387FA84D
MASFRRLSASYRWTLTPPAVLPFSGCVFELRHNDYLYDLNATDYHKMTFHPCDAPRAAKVVLGHQPATIIFASVLCLLLVVLVILCLARRTRKAISYPDLEREVVKETLGRTDVEGFGEKDVTNFDFKFLQVTPDGQLLTEDGLLPDVALEARQRRRAPLAQMPEGLSIGDFISENILKVDQEYEVPDDVIHFSCQDGGMSVASLSPLASDSSEYGLGLDWRRRNPRPFARPPAREDEGEAGEEEDEEEDDSDYEELDDPPRRVSSSFQESLPTDHSRSSSHSPASNTTSHSPSSTLSEAEEGSSSSALTPKEEEEEEEEEEEPSQDAMTLVLEEGVEGDEEEGEVEEEVNCLEDDVAASTSVACREHGTSC